MTKAEMLITSDPKIMMGKPVLRGTRITVEYLLRSAAAGMTVQEIIEQHPHLTEGEVRSAFTFAANQIRDHWLASRPEGVGAWQNEGPEWTTLECTN